MHGSSPGRPGRRVRKAAMANTIEPAQTTISLAEPGDYFALLKPRVMRLVVFTALTGMVLAPGSINLIVGAIAILAIAVGAGASGALNMWYDADIDVVMSRTAKRPVPAGKVTAEQSLNFGLILSAASVVVLGLIVNWVAGALLAFTIFFYAVIYTMWLKRSTPQNIVIGGAAGAFPPVIGWACVTGSVSIESLVLFAIIFIWTPPHFWALALFKQGDYETAGVPMMPNVAGERSTRLQMVIYSLVLAPFAVAPWYLGFASVWYALFAAVLSAIFVAMAVQVWHIAGADGALKAEKRMFAFSIFYLFAMFAFLLVEGVVARLGMVV